MRKHKTNFLGTILLIMGSLFILLPLYLTVVTAFKTPQELGSKSLLALPNSWSLANFRQAIEMTDFFHALGNSIFITVPTVITVILVHSMVSYVIARNMHKRWGKIVYYYVLSAMFVPFSIIMLPLVKQSASWGLDNRYGMIVLYFAMNFSFNIFLYVGYIQSIPIALEEAAYVDGATEWQTFWKVVFPLLKPMNATVAILVSLGTWNDFMLPLVIIGNRSDQATLPLTQYIFKSQFSTDYTLALASYLLAMLPMLIVYIFAQKWIINGVSQGAVKE